jgi:hypothetical protein
MPVAQDELDVRERRTTMKSLNTRNLAIASLCACCLRCIVVPRAFQYVYAAHRDERNGYPYTAAMEWRDAAELLLPITLAAEHCWRQWERIMHLPRQMAMPFRASHIVAFPQNAAFTGQARTKPVDQILIATAA